MNRLPKLCAVVGALTSALCLPSCDLLKPEEPPPPPPPPEVLVTPVVQRDVSIASQWLGTTDGLVNAEVRSRVQGYLISQHYTEGATLQTGDLLFEVDPRPFQAALAQAQADLSRAEAEQLRTQLDVDRLTPLAPSGAVSQQEVDHAFQANEANKASILAAKAAVQQAELDLEYTRITAPIGGIAGASQSQIGDLVGGPGGPILTTISTLDPIRVYVPISEQEYLRFQRNLAARAPRAPAAPGKDRPAGPLPIDLILADGSLYPHKGTIDTINRQVDSTTGTIRVTVEFPNPGNLLRPGQYARIRAEVTTLTGALLVPQRAVIDQQGMYLVVVVDDGGTASLRPVQVGERIGSEWIISSGLEPGERVVVEGVQKARDGQPVTARPYEPPAETGPAAPATGREH